ncbi:MAG: hypothetical protein J5994_10935 [Ruminococcus sp.]|nr:hypothetical protein [Ruminococcus sp.]
MKKTNELKAKLHETFSNRNNWNREVTIDGEVYIYISATNEIRRIVKQPCETIAQLVACLVCNFQVIVWCC